MSNPNWNKKVAANPPTDAELDAIRYHGSPLPRSAPPQKVESDETSSTSGQARNAIVSAGHSRREE